MTGTFDVTLINSSQDLTHSGNWRVDRYSTEQNIGRRISSCDPIGLGMSEGSNKSESVGEEWCPITATSSLICKKWHPVIVHRLLENRSLGFNALKREVDGISAKVLTDSLDDLEEGGIVIREEISKKPARVDYSLTELGQSLDPVITEMYDWGEKHLEPIEED